MPAPLTACLAFDTATEHLSIALLLGDRVWSHEAAGGALASSTLIPGVMDLLAQAGIGLRDLDAIAFGRGPGAFTGLRTACSVAQGLALGADKPVLPIDTLLAVAEDARSMSCAGVLDEVWVAMDARMDEIYAAHAVFEAGAWRLATAPWLCTPQQLNEFWRVRAPHAVAGTALAAFGDRLACGDALQLPQALPRARAMLPLAAALWAQGGAVDAAQALPLYLRDKVAQTMAERSAAKALAATVAPAVSP
ncbi:MAG: tRNA (adenosine(37)-N6)-threonylcarbamoyltransferase complex dimerization subunit type 1 TsaB [Burkholderiales bacterium PBB1]|nr:MAG: tRNA (adenosine(37)-N6)-threonylcarbamoyltransferase complex dimerization subunit type 1 TsaB [Burkholderiales bacterium PBB1]